MLIIEFSFLSFGIETKNQVGWVFYFFEMKIPLILFYYFFIIIKGSLGIYYKLTEVF